MNFISINTSQNVNLAFPIASIGDRMVAFVIDSLVKASYIIVLSLILINVFQIETVFNSWDNWSIMAFISVITLPVTFYTLIFESLMEGQTPGKKMMKCKVVKIDGFQAEFIDYLTRWAFRIIDILISSGVIGLLFVIFTKKGQRLGGLASGTAVISLKQKSFISQTILSEIQEDYKPQFPQVLSISDADMRIIVKNYQQALRENRPEVIHKLAEKIKEITQLQDQIIEMEDTDFIERIIKDFNFYTGKDK
ncbi:MAG: RDD family protein [Weeksellaceae bacterium]